MDSAAPAASVALAVSWPGLIPAMYVRVGTRPRRRACQTGPVFRNEIVRSWRVGLAWLRQATGQPARLTPWGWAADASLALLLTIAAVAGLRQDEPAPEFIGPRFRIIDGAVPGAPLPPPFGPSDVTGTDGWQWALVGLALTALPLVVRRRFPLTSFWIIVVAASQIYDLPGIDLTGTIVALVVAAYSAPTYSRYRNLALVSVVAAAVALIAGGGDDLPNLPSGLMIFLLLSTVGLAANVIHTWRQRAQTLRREQEAATRLAIEHERARLARELHDVVGHNVSVMVVQAGAARKVLDTSPELAREALLAVEAGGRAAMTELRQVIGLLTVDSDLADLAPQPGLDQLADLVERVRETGVPVTLTVTGTFAALPAGVELAAYRVVQEALTNAVKHAAGAAVAVTVTGSEDELRVEVTDTGGSPSTATAAGSTAAGLAGAGPAAPGLAGAGRGLTGLRERLSAYGGTLTAGRRPTGGFRVVAVAPLRAPA